MTQAPRRARPLEQRQPPRQAHRHAERKLVRRRDVDEARGARAPARSAVDVEAVGVDRHGHDPRARGPAARCARPGSPAPPSTRGHPGRAAGGRRARSPAARRPRPGPGPALAARAARGLDVAGDRLAQDPEAGRVAVVELRRGDRRAAGGSRAATRGATGNRSTAGVPIRKARGGPSRRRAPAPHRGQRVPRRDSGGCLGPRRRAARRGRGRRSSGSSSATNVPEPRRAVR